MPVSQLPPCRCGHDRGAHEHYRGDAEIMVAECALCDRCPRYRWPWFWRLRQVIRSVIPEGRRAAMAYEVWRGTRKFHEPQENLESARAVVEDDLARSPAVLAPFGGTPQITWAWNLDILEARGEDGRVAYQIRRVAGT